MSSSSTLVPSERQNRADLRVSEEEVHQVTVKKFSVEEMDEIIYLATLRAEAKAELRLKDKD